MALPPRHIPSVVNVTSAPTRIEPGHGMGVRASVTIQLKDHPSNDVGIDKYVDERDYNPDEQGTFWGKFRARNPYYLGRAIRINSGYMANGYNAGNFESRSYIIDRIDGPDERGTVTITAKDPLKLAENDRAKVPAANDGVLVADIAAIATSFSLEAGNGAGYPASGTIRIGDECMTFTRVVDAFTVVRGTDGTVADDHKAGDVAQVCKRFTNLHITDIIYDILVNYAEIPASYITLADWEAEADVWLRGTYTCLITEPTGATDLLDELARQALFYIWWDERANKVQFKAIRPSTQEDVPTLNDREHFIAGKLKLREDATERISRLYVYYDIVDPTKDLEEPRNYRRTYIQVDLDAESSQQYGQQRVRTIFARWMNQTDSAQVSALAGRLINRYRDSTMLLEFDLDAKDADIWTGDVVNIQTRVLQDTFGAAASTEMQILEVRESTPGSKYSYLAATSFFYGRYGFIAPNDAPNTYTLANDTQRRKMAFIAPNTGRFADGTEAYKII